MKKQNVVRAFVISLAALILVSILNWGVITGWGNIKITNLTIVGDYGKEYTALVYVPKNATNETPAPAMMCCHGYSGCGRNHESWAMEYARRGFVVLSYDNAGSGDGECYETVENNRNNTALVATRMLTYLENLPIVDKNNISVAGHSGGCNAILNFSAGRNLKAVVLADPAVFYVPRVGIEANVLWLLGTADKIKGIDDSLAQAAQVFNEFGANLGSSTEETEEVTEETGSGEDGESEGASSAGESAGETAEPAEEATEVAAETAAVDTEAAETATEGESSGESAGESAGGSGESESGEAPAARQRAAAPDPVEEGRIYTNENGTIYQHHLVTNQIHEGAFINKENIELQLDFVQSVVETPNPIPGSQQIWFWKDVLGLIGVILFAVWLCTVALLIMTVVPFFGALRQPLPRYVGLRGAGFAISTAVALIFPAIALYFGGFGLLPMLGATDSFTNTEYGIFRIRFSNIAMGVVIALTLMGMIMLGVYLVTEGRKDKVNLHDLGVTTEGKKCLDFRQIGVAFLLACIVILIGWTYLAIQRGILRTDFYCLFFGIKAIAARKFIYYIPYIVLWMICFVFAAVSMNVERRLPSTGNEKLDTLIAVLFNGLVNCLGITIVILIENALQLQAGAGVKVLTTWGTDVTRLWGMPLGMFVGGAGSTYCYRKTGSVWLGAFLFGAVAALMSCTFGQVHTITEIPFDPSTMVIPG